MAVVENKDLVANDLFVKTIEQGKALIVVLDDVEERFKKTLAASSKVKSSEKGFEKATNDRKNAVDGLTKVEQQREKVLVQLNTLETKQGKELEKSKIQLQQKRKAVRDEIKAEQGLTSEFQKQSKRLNELKERYKSLILQQGKETKATRKLRKEALVLDKTLKRLNKSVSSSSGLFSKLRGGVARLGLAFGGLAIIRNVFTTVKDFNQSIASLSAITGATGKDLDFFKQKAIEFGESTTLSAGQVAEAFKLIASAKPELLENAEALAEVTKQAIILSEAAQVDVTEAANAITLSLNQFGKGAEFAAKFIDVLAVGSKKGAGDITFLNASLEKAGGTADAAGLSFIDTVAAIETLAPVLSSGEQAGTKFRNILASLQKEGLGFASGQFNLNDALKETNKVLNAIDDPAKRAAKRIKLFGRQNDAAGIQLLNNIDTLEAFQESLKETGVAVEQQRINNDTLQGAVKALQSAWEGLILRFEEGTGVFGVLKDVIRFVARNLEIIVTVVGTLGTAFAVFKIINKTTKALKALSFVTSAGLGPLGLLLGAISAIVLVLSNWSKEATIAQKIQENLIDVRKEAAKATVNEKAELDSLLEVAKNKNLSDIERISAIQKLNEISPEFLGNLTLENVTTDEGIAIIGDYIEALDRKALAQALQSKKQDLFNQLLEIENSSLEDNIGATETANFLIQNSINSKAAQNNLIKAGIENRNKEAQSIRDQIIALNDLLRAKIEAGEIEGVTGGGGASQEEARIGLIKEVNDKIAAEREKITEAITVSDIRDAQAELKRLKKQKDKLLGIHKKSNEDIEEENTGFKSFFKQAVDDQIAEEERLAEEEEFLFNLRLIQFEEFIQKDKDLAKDRRKSEQQEDDRRLADFDAFREDSKEAAQKAAEDEEKALQKRAQLISDSINVINELIEEGLQERLSVIDRELAANQNRIDVLSQIDSTESQNAEENLAFAKKKQAELELQKQDEVKKAANLEATLALIGTYSSNIAAGQTPIEALANTAVSAIALKQLLSSIDFFWGGTKNTVGEDLGSPAMSGRDGHIVRVDGSEHIVGGKDSAALKAMGADTTNKIVDAAKMVYGGEWDIVNAAMYKNGINKADAAIKVQQFQSNDSVIEEFGTRIETAIKGIDMPDINFTWDKLTEGFRKDVETRTKLERFHEKPEKKWIS